MIKILAFAGSTRKHSYNKKLVKIAAAGASSENAEVTVVDLADLPIALFDEDLETTQGIPDNAMKLKKLMNGSDGFLISSPEYNGGYSAVLKNAIDWASRQAEGESPLQCFKNKAVTIMGTSPGGLGGIRGLAHLRTLLSAVGCIVLPKQLAVPRAFEVFDDNGNIKSEEQKLGVISLGSNLVKFIASIK